MCAAGSPCVKQLYDAGDPREGQAVQIHEVYQDELSEVSAEPCSGTISKFRERGA